MDQQAERPDARPIERPLWMTYAQAAAHLGLSPEAVRHRARRAGWRTQPGNDGRTLVMVPDDELPTDAQLRPAVQTIVRAPARTPDHQAEIARAHARAERAEARADEALQRADAADADRRAAIALADQTVTLLTDAVARADRAEAAIAGERQRGDELRYRLDGLLHDLDSAQRQARDAQAAAEAAQIAQAEAEADTTELRLADAARKGRGRLARLRAAWRGV
jgi:hypothetical protein